MKNKEFAETIEKAEAVVGELCTYTMAFIFVGLVAAFVR